MLVLPVSSKGPLIALPDDSAPGRFAVASARPRLARRSDGTPLLQLDLWTPAAGSAGPTSSTGGQLNLTVDVTPLAEELAASGLRADRLAPIPWLDASIELAGPLIEPVKADVAVTAGARGVIAIELAPEPASVLASLLTRDTVSPLQVTWAGSVLVRLAGVEVIASAAIDPTNARSALCGPGLRGVCRSLVEANAHVEIRGAANPELEAALREWALGELAQRLETGEGLSVRAGAAQVVRWPVRLATTLDDLVSADQRQGLVQRHVLDPDEMGQARPIEVRALGDFGGVLERVEVTLAPVGGGAAKALSIHDDQPQRVALGSAHFRWSYRAKLVSSPPGPWSLPREIEGSHSLLVPVPATGELRVEVLASGIDFEHRWSAVRVELAHQAAAADTAAASLEIDGSHPTASWTRRLSGPRGKLRAKLTFFSRQGPSVEQCLDDVPGDQLVVEDPLDSERRRLTIMPTGNAWDSIALAMVDLRYRDGDYRCEETIELKSLTDFVQWETPARRDGPRAIEWRCHASFRDGRFEQTAWQAVESDVLTVPLQAAASRQLQLVPAFFDSGRTPRLEVQLRSGGQEILHVVESRSVVSVTLPLGPYRWSARWQMADGTTQRTPEQESDEDVIVLPRCP